MPYIVNNLGWNEDVGRFDNHYQPVDEAVTEPVTYIGGWFCALVCMEGQALTMLREVQEDGTIVYMATHASDGKFVGALYLRDLPPFSAV